MHHHPLTLGAARAVGFAYGLLKEFWPLWTAAYLIGFAFGLLFGCSPLPA